MSSKLRDVLIIYISSFHWANRSNALFKSTSDVSSVAHRLFIVTGSPDIIFPCKPSGLLRVSVTNLMLTFYDR